MAEVWGDFYESACGSLKLLQGNILAHAAFVEEVARLVAPGMSVLEVGSGTGVLLWPVAQAGVRVVSLDNDKRILEMAAINAKALGANIEYVFGDGFSLPYVAKEFDVVISEGLLEHYSDSDIDRLVSEHRRVGMMVVVSVPLEGCKDRPFGNERWMPFLKWQVMMQKHGLIKCFPYRYGTRGCFTLVGEVAK